MRYPANYAVARPEVLPKVTLEAIPSDVLKALTRYVAACQEAGFSIVTWTHSKIIGHKQSYAVIMLHDSGWASSLAVWFRISLSDQVQERTVFSCQSSDRSGIQYSTGPVADREWIPELIPPDTDAVRLDVDTPPSETIRVHFDRVGGRSDLIHFNAASLEQQCVSTAQTLHDFMIERRFYVPITEAECRRLSAVSDIIVAELA